MSRVIRTILFDLDGTLLENDMDLFLKRYFELLAGRVAHLVPPQQFITHLLEATGQMMANDGQETNEEVFGRSFYPAIGHELAEMEPIFTDFYENDFPALRQFTRPMPGARQTVEAAFDLGYDVVIATQPVFPAVAIRQRLEWAGVQDYPYRLVTSYENSCASKPNPVYFEQILEAVGHSPQAALVVGDDAVDMAAARIGCATFFVAGPASSLDATVPEPAYRGTLADVEQLLRRWAQAE